VLQAAVTVDIRTYDLNSSEDLWCRSTYQIKQRILRIRRMRR